MRLIQPEKGTHRELNQPGLIQSSTREMAAWINHNSTAVGSTINCSWFHIDLQFIQAAINSPDFSDGSRPKWCYRRNADPTTMLYRVPARTYQIICARDARCKESGLLLKDSPCCRSNWLPGSEESEGTQPKHTQSSPALTKASQVLLGQLLCPTSTTGTKTTLAKITLWFLCITWSFKECLNTSI